MSNDRYSQGFYDDILSGSLASARRVLSAIAQQAPFSSVFDYGCGQGAWLKAAQENGATTTAGIEGNWLKGVDTLVDKSLVEFGDLEQVTPTATGPFDLIVCMEVLEHLSDQAGRRAVQWMAANGKQVLLSAAIPGQGGNNHINKRWQSYWVARFAEHGRAVPLMPRHIFWHDDDVEVWYRQNMLLFSAGKGQDSPPEPAQLDVVHPVLFDEKVRRATRLKKKLDGRLHKRIQRLFTR